MLEDFEQKDIRAEMFLQHTNLNVILGGIVDRHTQKIETSQNEVRGSTFKILDRFLMPVDRVYRFWNHSGNA